MIMHADGQAHVSRELVPYVARLAQRLRLLGAGPLRRPLLSLAKGLGAMTLTDIAPVSSLRATPG
jgi:hypothetical protein